MSHICTHCSRPYKLRHNFDRHVLWCQYIHRDKRYCEATDDAREKLPSQHELVKIVQELVLRCDQLEKRCHKLESSGVLCQKKRIVDVLKYVPVPSVNFELWFKSIRVDGAILNVVFEKNFTEGVKTALETILNGGNLPIWINQKAVYVYEGTWEPIKMDRFRSLMLDLSHKFMVAFARWQQEHAAEIDASEILQDQYIEHLMKINRAPNENDKRCSDIMRWVGSRG